jgi:hypothetical protein
MSLSNDDWEILNALRNSWAEVMDWDPYIRKQYRITMGQTITRDDQGKETYSSLSMHLEPRNPRYGVGAIRYAILRIHGSGRVYFGIYYEVGVNNPGKDHVTEDYHINDQDIPEKVIGHLKRWPAY